MQPDVRTSADPASVWLVEDSSDYRDTVQELVDGAEDLSCPHAFPSGEAFLAYLNDRRHLAPDLVLVDIEMPGGMSGIEVAEHLREFAPDACVVMLTAHEDNERIFRAICAGARGYLAKTATLDKILTSIRDVLAGGSAMTPVVARKVLNIFTQMRAPRWDHGLTDRERDVLAELVEGRTKKQMGKKLFLSEHTVDTHLRHIYDKLGVHTRTDAVVKAIKENLVPTEDED
jgi:DNA-binding NarL/FixJ family response regulator